MKRKQKTFGPSNDEPSNVQEEIEAAREEHNYGHLGDGWIDHQYDSGPVGFVGTTWRADWLAREMFTHDEREFRDANAWPWDPSRPVAGQFEEWVARTDANIAAMEDGAVASLLEQVTPHDPTGSPVEDAARHAWDMPTMQEQEDAVADDWSETKQQALEDGLDDVMCDRVDGAP